jgi:ATP-binding cassette, subfamily B, bacterial
MMQGHGMRRLANAPDEVPKVTWDLLKRVMTYARPYRGKLIALLVFIGVGIGLSLLSPLIVRQLIDHTIPDKDMRGLVLLALALMGLPALNGVLNLFRSRLSSEVGEGVIYDLRMELYSGLQRMSLRFFTNTKVGELMSRLNNDVVGAQNAISRTLVDIVTNIIQVVASLAVMLTLEWRITLISIVIFPLFIIAIRKLSNRLRDIVRRQLVANAQMNAMMNETLNIGGALLVKLFGRRQLEVDRFGSRALQVKKAGVDRSVVGSIFMGIVGLVAAVGTALVYGFGGYFVIKGGMTVGLIVAFGSYLSGLYGAFQSLANAPMEFATSVVSFERVFEVVDLPLDINEKPDAVVLKDSRGEIVFDDVTFSYQKGDEHFLSDVRRYGSMDNVLNVISGDEGEEKPEEVHHSQARGNALEHVSFCVDPGQLVALVGPSGAGKTTLTYLIPRLYDPTSGSIRIDGINLRDMTLESLTAQIGMVTQETYLFHDTIRTNLQYSKIDATQSELEEACRAANIHDYISELPDGYDTVVGERGYRLSGGEKQRIALARVILKDPRILVLDEATSSLDSESEALIQDALKKVMASRTSIVIAHRLSTILAADQILVIDRGGVMERGTHKELLAQKGLYAQLYRKQFRKGNEVESSN